MCYKELDKRFALLDHVKATKEKRIETILFDSLLPISKKEIADLLPDISITTIKRTFGWNCSENRDKAHAKYIKR